MSTVVHEFDWPDRIVVGTVGRPGERTFYLQARAGNRITSVSLEKEQSALLAEKVDEILDQLATHSGTTLHVPDGTPPELVDDDPLDQPVEEEFRTGAIGLGWDPSTAQILLEAYPYVESDDDEPDLENPSQVLRVRMPVGTARAFAQRARDVVRAGRPPCPLCGRPVDPDGHVCTPPDTP